MRLLPTGVLAALALTGCRPTFSAQGTLAVDGVPFGPTACRVLAPRATGVHLSDGAGWTLAIDLPPQRVDAWREVRGVPRVRSTPPGKPTQEFGQCGELHLEGEGYHGAGKRAVRGRVELDCHGAGATVQGLLNFSGCF